MKKSRAAGRIVVLAFAPILLVASPALARSKAQEIVDRAWAMLGQGQLEQGLKELEADLHADLERYVAYLEEWFAQRAR